MLDFVLYVRYRIMSVVHFNHLGEYYLQRIWLWTCAVSLCLTLVFFLNKLLGKMNVSLNQMLVIGQEVEMPISKCCDSFFKIYIFDYALMWIYYFSNVQCVFMSYLRIYDFQSNNITQADPCVCFARMSENNTDRQYHYSLHNHATTHLHM